MIEAIIEITGLIFRAFFLDVIEWLFDISLSGSKKKVGKRRAKKVLNYCSKVLDDDHTDIEAIHKAWKYFHSKVARYHENEREHSKEVLGVKILFLSVFFNYLNKKAKNPLKITRKDTYLYLRDVDTEQMKVFWSGVDALSKDNKGSSYYDLFTRNFHKRDPQEVTYADLINLYSIVCEIK